MSLLENQPFKYVRYNSIHPIRVRKAVTISDWLTAKIKYPQPNRSGYFILLMKILFCDSVLTLNPQEKDSVKRLDFSAWRICRKDKYGK